MENLRELVAVDLTLLNPEDLNNKNNREDMNYFRSLYLFMCLKVET